MLYLSSASVVYTWLPDGEKKISKLICNEKLMENLFTWDSIIMEVWEQLMNTVIQL